MLRKFLDKKVKVTKFHCFHPTRVDMQKVRFQASINQLDTRLSYIVGIIWSSIGTTAYKQIWAVAI